MDYNFGGVATLALVGFIAIVGSMVMGVYSVVDYFWLEDEYTSTKPIVPEMVIKSESRQGKVTSDTTYVYIFK